ncbi:MAG: GIY-YIG nuclease family protein [Candidatus Aminicenantes bacterium]|nr:GIY-YIG nuclease family protein [Candidatus Aminicenantes bacterium]
MTTTKGFSVRIFIPSGEPDELRIVEKSNWIGQGIVFPRALFAEVRKRDELKRPGVYILWGPSESGQLPLVYVGEGDNIVARLDQHVKQKDFWTYAVVFTSKDQNLNKAHIKYLEARLIALAAEAKRAKLDNNTVPQLPALSEADIVDAEAFLRDLLLCLPVVGVPFFEKAKAATSKTHDLFLKSKGIEARGINTAEGFVVRAGSQAVKDEVPSLQSFVRELRQSLIAAGVLEDLGLYLRLTQDYVFNSPSTAAGVLLGRSENGRTAWKDAKGRTLKEIEEAETYEE